MPIRRNYNGKKVAMSVDLLEKFFSLPSREGMKSPLTPFVKGIFQA